MYMRGGVRNHTASVKLLQVVHLTIPRRNSRKLGWNAYPTGPRGCWWWSRHPSCLVVFSLKPSDPSNNPRTHWLESFHPLRTPNQKQPKSPMTITFQNLPMQSYWTWRPTRCSPAYKTAIHHKLYPIPASQIPSPYWHQLVQKDSLFHPAISRWIKKHIPRWNPTAAHHLISLLTPREVKTTDISSRDRTPSPETSYLSVRWEVNEMPCRLVASHTFVFTHWLR